jgi:subtilisin family serine protease
MHLRDEAVRTNQSGSRSLVSRSVLAAAGIMALAMSALSSASSVAAPASSRYVIVLQASTPDPAATATQQGRRWGFKPVHVYRHALTGYIADLSAASLAALRADPTVAYVAADRAFARIPEPREAVPCELITGPRQCVDEWVDRVDAERSSTRSGDGRGSVTVNVAVVDSGIDATHPDLKVAGGVDCAGGVPVRLRVPRDRFDHGTHVAGLIGARDNGIGVVGTAPGTPLWSVAVGNEAGDITLGALVCAIDWVASTRQDSDPRNDIAVANMSLSDSEAGPEDGQCGLVNQDVLHTAICNSVAAGTTYVVSAGNEGQDMAQSAPPSYDEVLAVTAVADFDGEPGGTEPPECYGEDLGQYGAADDRFAPFSNYATAPDDVAHTIAAPGVCIQSTISTITGSGPNDWYGVLDGTSMASPIVAGTVALCIHSGQCPRSDPTATMTTILADAAAYNGAHPEYGFSGDPLRPVAGRYYGYLLNAGIY